MTTLTPSPKQQFIDANGVPYSGGKLYTYAAGTTTPLVTYSDADGTPNTNPVILDTRGEASIWLSDASYKYVLKTSADVTVWTQDDIQTSELAIDNLSQDIDALPQTVHSIAELRTLDKTKYQAALVLNYYSMYQGGGGEFYYDATDTTSADNGGTIIVAADGGRWKRVIEDQVNVKWFGAVGDGITDDTAAIQAAIDYRIGSGGRVTFPPGEYLHTGITVPSGVTLEGAGRGSYVTSPSVSVSTLKCVSGFGITISGTSGSSTTQVENVTIDSLSIDGGGTGDGLTIQNFRYVSLSNIQIKNCVTALLPGRTLTTDVSYGLSIRDSLINTCSIGIDSTSAADAVFLDASNVSLRSLSQKGVTGKFTGTWVGGFCGGNSVATDGSLFKLDGSQNFSVIGAAIENTGGVAGTAKDFSIGETTKCQSINIIGVLTSVSSASFGRSVSIDMINCYGGQVIGCQVASGGSDAAAFIGVSLGANADNIAVVGNRDESISGSKRMLAIDSAASANCLAMHNGICYSQLTFEIGTGLQQIWKSQRNGDTVQRWAMNSDGKQEWGSGSASRDTNLYRKAADILTTDDKFTSLAGIGVGNSAAGTTPGSVVRKMEIFNESGLSLGFIPIYDNIS